MAVKLILEPRLERVFHPSSFGYRPYRGAHQAVEQARRNCWRYDWVLDMDMKAFFDTIDHDLMMRAVEKHVPEKWMRLYIRRWLEASVVLTDGTCQVRDRGTPKGALSLPCWLTSICIMRSILGWPDTFPTFPLSDTLMMWFVIPD